MRSLATVWWEVVQKVQYGRNRENRGIGELYREQGRMNCGENTLPRRSVLAAISILAGCALTYPSSLLELLALLCVAVICFCEATPEHAKRFLEKNLVRWYLQYT